MLIGRVADGDALAADDTIHSVAIEVDDGKEEVIGTSAGGVSWLQIPPPYASARLFEPVELSGDCSITAYARQKNSQDSVLAGDGELLQYLMNLQFPYHENSFSSVNSGYKDQKAHFRTTSLWRMLVRRTISHSEVE